MKKTIVALCFSLFAYHEQFKCAADIKCTDLLSTKAIARSALKNIHSKASLEELQKELKSYIEAIDPSERNAQRLEVLEKEFNVEYKRIVLKEYQVGGAAGAMVLCALPLAVAKKVGTFSFLLGESTCAGIGAYLAPMIQGKTPEIFDFTRGD